jgi:hypothetical protein
MGKDTKNGKVAFMRERQRERILREMRRAK